MGEFGPGCERQLSIQPSEYFRRQCYIAVDGPIGSLPALNYPQIDRAPGASSLDSSLEEGVCCEPVSESEMIAIQVLI